MFVLAEFLWFFAVATGRWPSPPPPGRGLTLGCPVCQANHYTKKVIRFAAKQADRHEAFMVHSGEFPARFLPALILILDKYSRSRPSTSFSPRFTICPLCSPPTRAFYPFSRVPSAYLPSSPGFIRLFLSPSSPNLALSFFPEGSFVSHLKIDLIPPARLFLSVFRRRYVPDAGAARTSLSRIQRAEIE